MSANQPGDAEPESLDQNKRARIRKLVVQFESDIARSFRIYGISPSQAEDLTQEVILTLLRPDKVEEYDESLNFIAWARGVARFVRLQYFDRLRRRREVLFSPQVETDLIEDLRQVDEEKSLRLIALEKCMKELPLFKREIVEAWKVRAVRQRASETGATDNALYKQFARIKLTLQSCISARMQQL